MDILKSIKLILFSLKNRKIMFVLLIILLLPILTACSGTETVEMNANNNKQLIETEPEEIDLNNEEQLSEPETNPLEALFTAGGGKIAFCSTRYGISDIYLMDPDGENQINLTNNEAYECDFAWSPDGSKIAFISDRDSNYEATGIYNTEIYVMNADGSDPLRLTDNDIREGNLAWSPDGKKILFATNWDQVQYENPLLNWLGMEIGVMDADGSNIIRLTNNGYRDDTPAWSPDGSKIVFASDRDGGGSNFDDVPSGDTRSYVDLVGDRELYVMDADGGNAVRLTHDNWANSHPAWSLDGSKIAFSRERDGIVIICLMNPDGSQETCIENNSISTFEHAFSPSWSPDGKWILFSTNGNSGKEIYVMNASGILNYRLVEGGINGLPAWQP